jgi:hypothetical protein
MQSLRSCLFAVLLLTPSLIPAGCGSKEVEKAPAPPVKVEPKPPAIDTHYTAVSRFIAGMKHPGTNEFAELEVMPDWQDFASRFDSNWKQIEEKRLTPMRQWASTELAETNAARENVFYPFSGPDFLTAYTFFPHGKNYVFVGLEPPGDVPDLKAMDDKGRRQYYASAFVALHNLFLQSYFITREMDRDLRGATLSGITPVILTFMARADSQIVSVKHVAVDGEGKVVDVDAKVAKQDPVLKKSRGVRIEFLPSGEKESRTLFYFSANLVDDELSKNPGFVKYLANIGPVTTYVKSASYLMHYKTFGIVRDFCLKQSNFLLQDDSGIAYQFFDKKAWRIGLYGSYTTPIQEFRRQYEKDLAQAYKGPGVKPLPFAIGYNTSTGGVNLLLASKQQSEGKP